MLSLENFTKHNVKKLELQKANNVLVLMWK